jgi:hypothetical protein
MCTGTEMHERNVQMQLEYSKIQLQLEELRAAKGLAEAAPPPPTEPGVFRIPKDAPSAADMGVLADGDCSRTCSGKGACLVSVMFSFSFPWHMRGPLF